MFRDMTGHRTEGSFSLFCCHNQFVELFKTGDQNAFIVIALCIQANVSAHTPTRCLFAVIFHRTRSCYYAATNLLSLKLKQGKFCPSR